MNGQKTTDEVLNISHKGFLTNDDFEWETLHNGIRRKIFGYDENLMMAVAEFKKDAVGSIHSHPHTQVTFIARGSFEVQIDNEKKILKEGDSFFIAPSLEHGVTALEDSILVDVFTPYREDFLKK